MELNNQLKCTYCTTEINEQDTFCGSCGYPIKGSEIEQYNFRKLKYNEKEDTEKAVKKIKNARIILYILAATTLLYGFYRYFADNDFNTFVINLILSIIYFILGLWAKPKPFFATMTGLLIYLSIIILNAFIDPNTIYQGIILKIVFIVGLINAAYGAYKFQIKKI